MTPWSIFLLVNATLVTLFSAAAMVVSRAPGWREVRPYAWGAIAAAIYCSCDTANAMGVLEGYAPALARLSVAAAAAHLMMWFKFAALIEQRGLRRFEHLLCWVLCLGGAVILIPGVGYGHTVLHHAVPLLGLTLADTQPTRFAVAFYALLLIGFGILLVHFELQRRKGVAHARSYLVVMVVFELTGINDSFVSIGVYPGPYLAGAGLMTLVLVVGYVLARRFLSYASSLQVLSAQLERTVEQRGKELAQANQALTRAEKLAAVGQLAAGVAHEINNPAAVIRGNLTFLKEELAGKLEPELRDCIEESLTAVGRVARIVRELLNAGRVAGRAEAKVQSFAIADAVDSALTIAGPVLSGFKGKVLDETDHAICAMGQAELVAQVIANLVTNAAQAIGTAGAGENVRVTAVRRGESTVVAVEDEGPGIPQENQARVFEPFFTTKEVGKGTGLGLAVSIGLMQAQGGSLVLVHSRKGSTRFELTLPFSATPEKAADAEAVKTPRSLRLLLVDDDTSVLNALKRTLKSTHQVQTAGGVHEALDHIRDGNSPLDAVICDVAMPDGGGEGLFAAISELYPGLAARTFFITGGALSPASRDFIEQHRDRVLLKPFDSKQLFRLLEAIPA